VIFELRTSTGRIVLKSYELNLMYTTIQTQSRKGDESRGKQPRLKIKVLNVS